MLLGIGTDIVSIERITQTLAKHPELFKSKFFNTAEISYCEARAEPAKNYANRFAAKEAFSKALGTGFGQHLEWKDITITRDELGKPGIELSKKVMDFIQTRYSKDFTPSIHLSLSDEKEYSIAFVIIDSSN